LGGFNYDSTIFFQILMLAFIPALTYLLTSKLSNRLAGIIAGGLILLREKNAIELSDKIVTSNAKLMMSDMVAMLGILAFVYITLKILSRKADNFFLLGIAGACLGLTALVRAQVIILVPPLLLFMLVRRMPLKLGIRDSTLIMLGFALVLLPWGWRNWQLTGTFVLDDRGEERLLARNYSSNPSALPPPLPGETEKQFSARLKQEIAAFIVQHPSDVTFFISNHFFRNLATSLVYMAPLLSNTSPRELIATTPLWEDWEGQLSGNGNISILITLTFIALGVAITQKKNRLAGWFLLITFLFYNFGNALVRSSGWRFSLPVEWVILVYYSVALAYFPSKIKIVFDGNAPLQSDIGVDTVSKKQSFGLIVFFILLLMGASVPIAEQLTHPRDFSNSKHFSKTKKQSSIRGLLCIRVILLQPAGFT
jgi:4-amino-4-deoxy-L-arabinose transferase-like glycosyltransferase